MYSQALHIDIRSVGNCYVLSCLPETTEWKPLLSNVLRLANPQGRGGSSKPKRIRSILFEIGNSVEVFIIHV